MPLLLTGLVFVIAIVLRQVVPLNPLNPLTVDAVNTCPFDENARLILARDLAKRLKAAGWASRRIRYYLFFPRGLARLRPLEARLGWLPLGAQYVASARKI